MAPRHRDTDDPGLRDIYLSNVPNKGLGKYTYFLSIKCVLLKKIKYLLKISTNLINM